MKVVSALRKRCNNCKFVRRGKKLYVKCDTFPRHKQRQGFRRFSSLITFTPPHPNITDKLEILGRELLVLQSFCSALIR